jgi:hypothetical protein
MKLRFLLMGCILSALSVIFLAVRGYSEAFVGLLVVGVALLVLGILWK